MNAAPCQNTPYESHKFATHADPVRHLLASAHSSLQQPPPPSLREILAAYRSRGDGDREMLLALLNAKTAEDQRLSSIVSLHRAMLEIYQSSSPPEPHHSVASEHYPLRPVPYSQPSSHRYHQRVSSPSRSPPGTQIRKIPQEFIPKQSSERPSKRHRLSRSPYPTQHAAYESSHPEHYPLSPYSSSERSDSAEYSPRSKSSMTIGSLLSTRPTRETSEDVSREGD